MMKTKFDFNSIEVAALMQAIFCEGPECSRPVCDGFAEFFRAAHETMFQKLAEPVWKKVQRNPEQAPAGHQQWWQEVEKRIVETADKIGLSIVLASIESPSSPRILEQTEMDRNGHAKIWGKPSPCGKWEQQCFDADNEDLERMKKGEEVDGAKPCSCAESEEKSEEAGINDPPPAKNKSTGTRQLLQTLRETLRQHDEREQTKKRQKITRAEDQKQNGGTNGGVGGAKRAEGQAAPRLTRARRDAAAVATEMMKLQLGAITNKSMPSQQAAPSSRKRKAAVFADQGHELVLGDVAVAGQSTRLKERKRIEMKTRRKRKGAGRCF